MRKKKNAAPAEYYAYTHSDPDGAVFYVGKGNKRRAHLTLFRSAKHQQRINEIGRPNVKVTLYPAVSNAHACNIESAMIARLKEEGAPLCNMEGVVPRKRKTHIDLDQNRAAKLKRLGSEWLNKAIDRAKEPKEVNDEPTRV